MDLDRHSLTAILVAALRAYHLEDPPPHIFEDRFAARLLTDDERAFFEAAALKSLQHLAPALAEASVERGAFIRNFLRVGAGAAGVLARGRFVEESLLAAVERGVRQYVIIGAGLDTFVFRRPDLADRLQVIEIDHPVSQAFKRERLANAGFTVPTNLSFAAANLETESLATVLGRTSFRRDDAAFFAWPGVTPYLTRPAVFETLRSIVSVANADSELVFDYLELAAFLPDAPERLKYTMEGTRKLGEPMLSGFDPATIRSEVAPFGLEIVEDLGPRDVQARYLAGTDGYRAFDCGHLVRAVIQAV